MPGFTRTSLIRGDLVSDCPRCHTPLPGDGGYCSQCPPDFNYELGERLARALEGRYEIIRLLGRGGMAAVFLANDLVLERQVAIKVLPPDMTRDGELIVRFQQEAKTAARLDHPNIIPIHRVESEAGLVYIVMKYVSGQSLEEVLDKGPLPIPQVRHVLREAALALGHAHRRHVVHRDVKPANIMLDDDGRVVLTDFGISKAVQGASNLTGTGTIIGTPAYMAPEQAKGREVDGRADQYALAIVGHRALTGKLPFEGDAHGILYQQVFEPPPSVLDRRPDTPSDLRDTLDRALAKDSRARFPTMEEFAASVSGERTPSLRTGATTVVSIPVKRGEPPKPDSDPYGTGVYVAMGTVVVVIAAAFMALSGLRTAPDRGSVARAVPPAAITAPKISKSPPASRPQPRRPVAAVAPARPGSKKGGAAKLRAVEYTSLSVRSTPRGVLYVDGVKVGLTPITNYRLTPGTYRLRVEQKGYRTVAETIVVKGTRPIQRRYGLRRQAGR
jgi:eukaryotic-like serine/threonine-protein kinase